jgi:hypothetical protein
MSDFLGEILLLYLTQKNREYFGEYLFSIVNLTKISFFWKTLLHQIFNIKRNGKKKPFSSQITIIPSAPKKEKPKTL